MADSYIAIDEPATVDKKLDTEQLSVGANTVERERIVLSGTGATDFALPVAHDAADAGNPLKIGGKAKAAAPADVSADADRVNAWFLLNGAQAVVLTAAGALIAGDAANGLDVDVTRSALPSGASTSANQTTIIGHVDGLEGLLTTIDADTGALAAAVSGAEMQVDIVTSALPAGAATSAKQDTQTTAQQAIQTSVELIDDAIVADDAAFTPATTKVLMAGFECDDTAPDSVNEGDAGAARMSARREIYTQIRDAAGNERGANVNASNELLVAVSAIPSHAVTNAGTFAVQVDGNALTALQLIDDPVVTLGTSTYTETTSKGMTIGAVRRDADTTLVDTTNEFGPLQMDANGRLKVEVFDGGDSHTVDNAGTFAVQDATAQASLSVIDDWDETDRAKVNIIVGQAGVAAGAGAVGVTVPRVTLASDDPAVAALQIMDDWDNTASDGASVSGDVAHDGVDAGEPVKVGLRAIAHGANPTAVAAADRTNWYSDRHGIAFVHNGHPFTKSAVYLNTAGVTDDNVLPAIAGGTKYVIYGYSILLDEACSVTPAIRLGFGAASVPALPSAAADAVDGILEYHPGMVPGTGIVVPSCYLVGGDGEELRITCDAATSGTFVVRVHYGTIES